MITIEVAESKHLPQIFTLWWELMEYHVPFEPLFVGKPDIAEKVEQRFGGMIETGDITAFIAIENDEVIGCSLCMAKEHPPIYSKEHYGFIMGMAVKQGHRRRGVGTMMLEKIYEWAKLTGLDRMELHVVPKNESGYSFWEKHGFADYIHELYKEI